MFPVSPSGQSGIHIAKGDGTVSQGAAESLVNTLANLRAARWVGATNVAAHGLEKPNVVISFTLADRKTGKVTVGSNTPEELWHTTLDGKPGTFLLSKPDFDALNASLIETPKPAAAAGSAVTPPVSVTTPPVSVPPPANPPGETKPATDPKPQP